MSLYAALVGGSCVEASMSQIESLIFLLGATALLAQLARFLRVPYPVLLVLGGLLIGFVPWLPTVEISPEVIFLIFLPPLLNYAAFFSSPRDLRLYLRPLLALAIGLVLFTTAAIALIAYALIGLPWAAAFVLGAILAPTDPVAAEAIFRRLGVPGRVSTIVGGESLVNDGTGLVAYRLAVAAVVTGAFSVWEASLSFLLVGGGGIVVGLILARTILPLWKRVKDPSIFIALSLLTPYAVYVLAEEMLHVSGILAVVSYGLYRGWRDPKLFPDASTRIQNISFWNMLVFLLESLLFVLVGQQLPAILEGLGEYAVAQVLVYAVLVYVALVSARFLWFFTTPYLHPVFDLLLRNRYLQAPWQERLVMVCSGMRGAVSLAAALAIPLVTNTGEAFPGRDLIIFLIFSAILATLVLQGLTLTPLIGWLRLEGDE
jgi:Na+/H+ antiporter